MTDEDHAQSIHFDLKSQKNYMLCGKVAPDLYLNGFAENDAFR